MSDMNSIYEEEVLELLEKLESSLLLLEITPNDDGLVEEIFRSMHTIKGSSGMFGYDNVAAFVHNLESIYDQIREGKLETTKQLIDVTLTSLDHIKRIVKDPDLKDENNDLSQKKLTDQIISIMGEQALQVKNDLIEIKDDLVEKEILSYYISFIPNEDIFDNGTNPLFILDELFELGDCKIFPQFKNIENIEDFDPTKCLSFWELLIATKSSKEELKDVFLFVEGDSEIKIETLCNYNIVEVEPTKSFVTQLNKIECGNPINIEELKKIISDNPVQKNKKIIRSNSVKEFNKEVEDNLTQEKRISSIRVASDKLDSLMNIVSELVTTKASLSLYAENNPTPELEIISENVEKLSRQLRDTAFGMTLIPIKNIMNRFQRLIRDVSAELGKTIDFEIEGDETELDKNIIESLTDPLMHILRNSLDHGIESKDERQAVNKSPTGKILLKAFYSGPNVHIQIKDDGKGINPEIIKAKAVDKGLLSEDADLSEKEILDFIFHPGFSTVNEVTDVSGRGVGMDVVRRNINDIRGSVEIYSVVGVGTTLTIKLPLTLSIVDGLLVKIGSSNYVVPLSVVEKCHEVSYNKLDNLFNKLLLLDGEQIPFLNLREEFKITDGAPKITQIIIVNNEERKVAISVDNIIDEYQAVLKPISKYYKDQEFISGATILGDGTVALVLDTNKIVSKFSEQIKKTEKV
tara:strand:- start:537 stop:2612 length:2076 start_codon:yes stop_codon:yes gene_type:complete